MARARIAVVGSYGAGLTIGLGRTPGRGETIVGDSFRTDHGGKGSNQAIGAARLGAEVSLLTAVGDDELGAAAFRLWAEEGVRADSVLRVDLATMVGVILVEPSGDNRIVIVPGALEALRPEDVDAFAPRIAESDLLLVQLEIPLETALHALDVARAAGVRTILNPAPAPPEPIEPNADYVTPNESEAPSVAGAEATLVLTLGAEGARLGDERISAFSAHAVDSTGAGDAFNAAFAVAVAEGRGDPEAARWGCAAGAHMVEHHGVIPGLPTRAELERRLEAVPA